jgi:alkanesulfonate monooxygenase SsuD/methylene tetrahydromethanopterin reductase-like flavin-dependent oxidoreductase (luciferase family)
VRGFIPVLVAGNGEKRTLDLAARYGDACNVFGDLAEVQRRFEVLDRHCERAGRDPAEITRTVAEFDARDLGTLASSARAMAAVGADGMIVACPDDPARIAAIGKILGEHFAD